MTALSPTTPTFDVGGPIPVGSTTLIEASAGTGKTYTLASLCTRLVAEHGVPIDRILLVTFTRAATAELRGRVRRQLVDAERHLAGPACDPAELVSPVLAALERDESGGACTAEEREHRRARLATAISDFDAATISTIHGFCSQVRASVGVLAEHNTDAVPTQSESDLITQVCADLYFRALSLHDRNPFGRRTLGDLIDLVKKARTLTGAAVEAHSGLGTDRAAADMVREAAQEVDTRLRRQGGQSFDSLLVSVRDALANDQRLIGTLRDQYPVALIDEFQDTDPVQWEIFRTVFADGVTAGGPLPRALFLVGDPKQAIYSFRGGDIYTYLSARSGAETRALTTNHRSDAGVLQAMNALAAEQIYGEQAIAYHSVATAPANEQRHTLDARNDRALPGIEIRTLDDTKDDPLPNADGVRRMVARDLAKVVVEMLNHTRVVNDGVESRVTPGHIAVLVAATSEARPVATALREAGVPAVLRLRDDVADSDAREQWRTLLHALDRPGSTNRATAAALTWFFGWSPQEVIDAVEAPDDSDDHRRLVRLQHDLVEWDRILTEHGMAALYGETRRSHDMVERLLHTDTGERDLTDLEHLAELIHAEARSGGRELSAGTALEILDTLGGTPDDELAADAAQRRIDSDADAVQIMTIHGSKGLEFPFVLLPFLFNGGARVGSNRPYTYFDEPRGSRVIDISAATDPETGESRKSSPTDDEAAARDEAQRQNCGDQHRLTYVALTRAVHRTVLWWSPKGSGVNRSGLSRMLLGAAGTPAAEALKLPKKGSAASHIEGVVRAHGADSWVDVTYLDPVVLATPPDAPAPRRDPTSLPAPGSLREAVVERPLDRMRKVWSFSSISSDLHLAVPDHELADPAVDAGDDTKAADQPPGQDAHSTSPLAEHPDPHPAAGDESGDWDQPSPYAGLGGGKDFGNLVHHVLEVIDFRAGDLEATIGHELDRPIGHRVTPEQRDRLPAVLAQAIRTPLGPPFDDLSLADLAPSDRLNELTFHFALSPEQPLSAGRIGALIADHLSTDDPLHAWALGLQSGLATLDLQGFLNGSIDLTLRQQVGGGTRYSVVDYKTNNLAPGEPDPTLQSYRPGKLTRAMADNQYALQALVYSVALHRYLRWRVSDYDPTVHLGPVGYLFIRGMVGSDTPTRASDPGRLLRAGVFTWQVPHELVTDLSALFAGDHRVGGVR